MIYVFRKVRRHLRSIVENASGSRGVQTSDRLFIQEVVVYPNPTNGLCYIKLDNPLKKEINVEVFTIIGQKVLTNKASANEIILDLTNYSKGTYLIKISKEEHNSYKRIIKN